MMTEPLPPELEQFVAEEVAAGHYGSEKSWSSVRSGSFAMCEPGTSSFAKMCGSAWSSSNAASSRNTTKPDCAAGSSN